MQRLACFGFLVISLSTACGGGQSFDDGGDPVNLMEADEDPMNGVDASAIVDVSDGGRGGEAASANAGDAGASDPTPDGSAGVSATPSSGGAAGAASNGGSGGNAGAAAMAAGGAGGETLEDPQPEDEGLPPGSEVSLGSVQFEFTAEMPEQYCSSTEMALSVRIEDDAGNTFAVGTSPDACGARPCTSCEQNLECTIGDAYFPSLFAAGGSVLWDGLRTSVSTCVAEGATLACLEGSYAPAGSYVAVYCAVLGEVWDSPPDECRLLSTADGQFDGPLQECVRVAFEYPSETMVSAELLVGGIDEAEMTFSCGNQSCAQSSDYCFDRSRVEPAAYRCEPLPDECLDERTCTCLTPSLGEQQGCLMSAIDGALRVLQHPE